MTGRALEGEGLKASKSGVWRFLKGDEETKTIERKQGSGRPSIINEDIQRIVDETMQNDDETTSSELAIVLHESGYTVSRSTVHRCRAK